MAKYNVHLWCGAGYQLTSFNGIEAEHAEQALEIAVTQAEEKGLKGLFWDECEDLAELEEQGLVLYVDATLEGAKEPHYVDLTNLRIEELKNE